jgi:pimeloyl-ACP methyl ester carboxylesterase
VRATHYVLLFLSLLLVSPALHGAASVKDGSFTTSDGVKLHYLESGAGSTILFVPGWTMPAEIWQPQIEYFSKSYHVVAVDGSQAEVFEDAGHCLFVDDADRFDTVLATFLQKASLGSRK